ncbi:MAG TPA: ATP-binding protein [Blastocatellia bacterium]|nr:ATP-binding protein [Blastocatellia bacterium]
MEISADRRILGRLRTDEFVGRESEIERIRAFGTSVVRRPQLAMLRGQTRVGKTELLRQSFDRIFNQSGEVAPTYYALKPDCLSAQAFAQDFAGTFLAQLLAFRQSDPSLLRLASEPLASVARSARAEDYPWVKGIADAVLQSTGAGDSTAILRCALSGPALAAQATGFVPLVMFDNVHLLASKYTGAERADAELRSAFFGCLKNEQEPSIAPRYMLCGLERPMTELMPPDQELFNSLEIVQVEPVGHQHLEEFIHAVAAQNGVETSDSATELMIHQLKGDLFYTRAVLDAAASAAVSLRTFVDFERVYSAEITSGRIGQYLGALIGDAAPGRRSRRDALEVLACISDAEEGTPIDSVIERMALETGDAEELCERLHARELLNFGYRFVSASDDPVLADYARQTYRSEVLGTRKPIVGFPLLAEKLKDAHRLMMARYDRRLAAQLVESLSRFDSQSVPASLFDEAAYEKRHRGMSRAEATRSLDDESERVTLPQLVEVEDAGGGEQGGISWRLFLAGGFETGIYSESNETLWIAALVNSREPLDVESLGRIDERIGAALRGRRSKPDHIVRWYIGKEGFSAAACQRIEAAQAFRSNYAQLEAMSDYLLKLSLPDASAGAASEFELIIPVEDEAELIAARTVEHIARTAAFGQDAINQIKTAVIEACINAAEHGQSPDGKIHQRFAIHADRIMITVSNKGRMFGPANGHPDAGAVSQPRGVRGRGLNIIRALMDEVRFQRTDDGTSLVMTKFLKRPENQ